ncbi:MAG: oligosaccharide flippase family protein [Elusimicrobiota bacterium]
MLNDIRVLGKETLAYGLSTVLARLLNFLLLPLHTHFLLPGDFGVQTTVYAYIAILNIVFQLGMDQAYLRHAAQKGAKVETVFSTAFWPLLGSAVLLASAMHWLAAPLAVLGGVEAGAAPFMRYAAWILALDAVTVVPFADLRLSHRVWTYVGVRAFNIALNVCLNFYFLAGLGLGVRGVFLASLVASAATLVLLAPVIAQRLRPACDGALLPELMKFGLPLIPAGISAMIVQVADRPILLRLMDKETVGVYQANCRLAIPMLMLVAMFDQAWRPFFLERMDKPDSRELYARVFTYSLMTGIFAALALSFFMRDIVAFPLGGGRTLIPHEYWSGLCIVPVALAANVLRGAYINFMASVTISKRTDSLIWVTALGAAVFLAANFLFIPFWGMMGAAWAAVTAQGAMALSLYRVGQKVHPIPYEGKRVALLLAAAGVSIAVRAGCPEGALARLAALALMPVVLILTGFFKDDEKQAFASLLGKLSAS